MDDYYDLKLQESTGSYKACFWCGIGVMLLMALLWLTSCTTTKYVPVETVRTEYITKHDSVFHRDSVYLHDSVYIHAIGDTVWYEKWHTRYVDRIHEVIKTDTMIKLDSIQVPYPVERKLSKWEQVKLDYGGEAIVVFFIIFIVLSWLIMNKILRR
jgi:hypothetical protein